VPGLDRLPTVVVGIPYHHTVPGAFLQAVGALMEESHRLTLTVRLAYSSSAAVHIAREGLLRHFLDSGCDYLVMVDSDQVFHHRCVERLVAWQKPLVAPLIVNRLGDPKPVAFHREGTDLRGMAQYTALVDECWAYLSQYDADRLNTPSGCLPLDADHPPEMRDVPADVRAGLGSPLLAVDAVGGGMVCVSRECARGVDPGPDDRYFDWEHGGEDLSFCRRVLASGYDGYHPDWRRGHGRYGVFVDRGCLVGHLAETARGAQDLGAWLKGRGLAMESAWDLGDLAEQAAEDGARPTAGPWREERLPEEVGR